MRQYPENRYVPGTYKRECDTCGFDFLRSQMIKDSKGLIVCSDCYDPKHPRENPKAPTAKPSRWGGGSAATAYKNIYLTAVTDDTEVFALGQIFHGFGLDAVADDTTVGNVAISFGGGGTYLLDINTGVTDGFVVNAATKLAAQTFMPTAGKNWAINGGEIKVKNAGVSAVTATIKLYGKLPSDPTRNLYATATVSIPVTGANFEWVPFGFSAAYSIGANPNPSHIEISTDGDVTIQGDTGLYADGVLYEYDVGTTTWSTYLGGGAWDMNIRLTGIESEPPPR